MIEIGSTAPGFILEDQDGAEHSLAAGRGKHVVLYFYPKDDTPGCTKEACQFRDAKPRFEQADAMVLGISPQDVKSKAKFAAKHDLNFPILADLDAMVCQQYGVWQEKSMYGKKYMGVVRTTYLIGPDGVVLQRWDKVKVAGHEDEILEMMTSA
jgi:peroxiredoxin Q/BCP